jgi:LmbE family N-acetylglucosaminyl deacetylase
VAVGAHPDDVEIGCGGSLARLAEQGYRVGIIDLTDGEPTPFSPGPDVRRAEARKAAEILGVCRRVTLDLPNRRLFDGFEARVALAKEFRRLRPRLVLGIGHPTPTASPDHHQAMLITDAAVFYARLSKWEEHFEGLPPHHVATHLYFFLGYRAPAPCGSTIVFDITATLETKLAALAAYRTQFAHRPELLDRVRTFNQQQGMAAGFGAGEVLGHPNAFGTRDLMALLFGREGGSDKVPR